MKKFLIFISLLASLLVIFTLFVKDEAETESDADLEVLPPEEDAAEEDVTEEDNFEKKENKKDHENQSEAKHAGKNRNGKVVHSARSSKKGSSEANDSAYQSDDVGE